MRKLIASINLTLDGFCDHTAVIADDELHQKFNELLRSADIIIFGRITYQLMESSWPEILKKPTGIKSVDEFAELIDNIHKIVFSKTLEKVDWKNTTLKRDNIKEEVIELKNQPGKNIVVGSPSMINTSMQLNLVDEYQFCVHPVILGSGLPLFKNINSMYDLILKKTEILASGAVMMYYESNLKQ